MSDAKKDGEIGVEKNRTTKRIAIAEMEQEAKLAENERAKSISISDAELARVKAESDRIGQIAAIEADMAAKERESELQLQVELKRKQQLIEMGKADIFSKAMVEAEAMERIADAKFYEKKREAEAFLIQKNNDAEGVRALYEAQAQGLEHAFQACGNNPQLTQFYLAINAGLYQDIARSNADAVNKLRPKIHIWNTGANSESNNDALRPILNIVQGMAPMHKGIQEQTDIGHTIRSIISGDGDGDGSKAKKE